MSIVRVGLSETQKFAEGYEAIFGKKKATASSRASRKRKTSTRKKKKPRKK